MLNRLDVLKSLLRSILHKIYKKVLPLVANFHASFLQSANDSLIFIVLFASHLPSLTVSTIFPQIIKQN